jgi:PAS domain S-box-containing protein
VSNLVRHFLQLFLPVAALLASAVWIYGEAEIDREFAIIRATEQLNVDKGAAAIHDDVAVISGDLAFLSTHSALRNAIERTNPLTLAHLAEDMANFSRSKAVYDQIRWIDETGMERVRIDRIGGRPVVIPPERLQHKGKRYFFTDTMKLQPGEVFISPLDLNIEGNAIEVPYKPMLRVATPVAEASGKPRGIVILNFLGRELLESFVEATGAVADHAMVLNGDGYFLRSPRAEDEWGFMFKAPEKTVAARAPEAWAQLAAKDAGQVRLADGLWTWRTVRPLLAGHRSSTGAAEAFVPSQRVLGARDYVWKAVAHLPTARLALVDSAVWSRLAPVFTILLGIFGIGCYKLAQAWDARELAESEVQRVNAGLELKVAERTRELENRLHELDEKNAELRESDQRFHTLADQGLALIWTAGTDKLCNYFNQPWLRFTGRTLAQELGNGWAEGVHPDDFDRCVGIYNEHFDRREPFSMEYRLMHADGRYRWIIDYGNPRQDSAGAFIGYIGFCYDITERKDHEQAIVASRDRLSAILQTTSDAVWLSDDAGRIIDVNPAACAMLGYSRDEMLERTVSDIEAVHDPAIILDNLGRLRREGSIAFESRHRRKDGRVVDVDVSISHVPSERINVAFVRDITERKLSEQALAAAKREVDTLNESLERRIERAIAELNIKDQQLTRAEMMASLGRMVAVIAHELNTPVGNSRLAATTLRERVVDFAGRVDQGIHRSELKDLLQAIDTGTSLLDSGLERAAHLISSFKQIAVDQTSAQRRAFGFDTLIDEITTTMTPSVRRSGKLLRWDAETGIELDSCPGPLTHVLINLVDNALRHGFNGRESGEITIEARRLATLAENGSAEMEIRVTDNGVGIPPQNRKHLFEPFFTTQLGRGGSGLGLSIVYNLVTGVLGGSISVTSEVDKGTTFVVRIPTVAPEPVDEANAGGHPGSEAELATPGH